MKITVLDIGPFLYAVVGSTLNHVEKLDHPRRACHFKKVLCLSGVILLGTGSMQGYMSRVQLVQFHATSVIHST